MPGQEELADSLSHTTGVSQRLQGRSLPRLYCTVWDQIWDGGVECR